MSPVCCSLCGGLTTPSLGWDCSTAAPREEEEEGREEDTTNNLRAGGSRVGTPPGIPPHPPWRPGAAGRWCSQPRRTWSAACGNRPAGRGHQWVTAPSTGDARGVLKGGGSPAWGQQGPWEGCRNALSKTPEPSVQTWLPLLCLGRAPHSPQGDKHPEGDKPGGVTAILGGDEHPVSSLSAAHTPAPSLLASSMKG